jgi:hypothetical protein
MNALNALRLSTPSTSTGSDISVLEVEIIDILAVAIQWMLIVIRKMLKMLIVIYKMLKMLIVICRSAADPTGRALPSSRRRVVEIPLVTLGEPAAHIVEVQRTIAHKAAREIRSLKDIASAIRHREPLAP